MARAEALADAQPAIDVSLWLELALVDLTPEEQQLVGSFHYQKYCSCWIPNFWKEIPNF